MDVKKRNLLIAVLLIGAVIATPGYRKVTETVNRLASAPVVVIDPGHGGIDGGAQSSSGMCEKDINLSIGMMLERSLKKDGIRVVMTRRDDKGLYDENKDSAIRSLKTEDMKKRRDVIDKSECDLAVSIHLNSFTQDPGVKGAQVFYPSEGEEEITASSAAAAEILQKNLNESINKEKPRTELAKNDVLLLRDVTCPTVIVECGFLSNDDDAANLRSGRYQKKLVKVLQKSVEEYLTEEAPESP